MIETSVRTIAHPPSASPAAFATGTYTGNGLATQAIAGVGFQPIFLIVYQHLSNLQTGYLAYKATVDGLNAKLISRTLGALYDPDHIISLDVDGFTVGDGTGSAAGNRFNTGAVIYSYIAYG